MGSSNVASLYFVSYIGHKVITVTFSPTISLPLPISASRSSFLCLSHFLFFSSRALSLSLSLPLCLSHYVYLSVSLSLSFSLSLSISLSLSSFEFSVCFLLSSFVSFRPYVLTYILRFFTFTISLCIQASTALGSMVRTRQTVFDTQRICLHV